ncbi:MAG: hypothetical protein HJJLKODD_01977 [Phycisphaerae bacterium]|nr:hypothetical protein [Phycisphaerae bacterium]
MLMVLLVSVRCTQTAINDNNDNNNQPPPPMVFELSPSGRVAAVIDPEGFAELVDQSATEPRTVIQPLVEPYITEFARQFPNAAEFVFFMPDEYRAQQLFTALAGFTVTLKAPESGLGPILSISDFPELSDLRSYIYLARKDMLVLGPSLHELAHGWGARFSLPQELGDQIQMSGNHWGYSSVGGQLGGWTPGTLLDLGNGQFEISDGNVEPSGRSFNSVPYAPLEMYIMGLGPAEEVEPIKVAINPVFQSLFQFSADGIAVVTIDDIIFANGPRKPDFLSSPRNFEATLLILTDHSFSDAEWRFYEDSIDFLTFPGEKSAEEVFTEALYGGQRIRELILQKDPEDQTRDYINFHQATAGQAALEFITLTPPAN